MRNLPNDLRSKITQAVQANSTNAAPTADVWISRPTTTLRYSNFVERQLIVTLPEMKKASIAACHNTFGRDSIRIYAAYIADGVGHVIYANASEVMNRHIWVDSGYLENATVIAIAFDGSMPKSTHGSIEFITETDPWVFWVNGGALYARKLNDTGEPIELATENVTAISAVRAMWSEVGNFDFGLILFFIVSGSIYYRQYINGTWTDAAPINFGPAVAWKEITASRTWDYRVALQGLTSEGILYEMFTQFEGIGKQNTEHINIPSIMSQGNLIDITYINAASENENISISDLSATASIIYGLTSLPVSVANADDGTGNWGFQIEVNFDHYITGVEGNAPQFVLTDGNNVTYTATDISLSQDGLVATLILPDFNLAWYGQNCVLSYTPGSIQCAAAPLAAFSYEFNPTNLVAPSIDPPVPSLLWNE